MDTKVGIMAVVLVLGVMFTGQVPVMFAQTPRGSAIQRMQSSNDTSTGKVSNSSQKDSATQTSSKIPSQKTQSSDDTSSGKVAPKVQFANETTKKEATTDNNKNLIGIGTLMLGIAAVLGVLLKLAQFIHKVKSKVDLPYSAEDIDKRDIAEKLDKIQKAVEQSPKISLIQKAIADAYMLQQDERIEEAIEKWRSVANIVEGNDNDLASKALASVGYLCLKEGAGERALSALNKAINLKPDFNEAYNNRGTVKSFLGRHQDAIADYDAAIRLKPDYVEAYGNRGTTKNLLRRHQDAIADYDIAIRLKPNNAQTYHRRGLTKYLLKKHKDAIADYDTAIRLKTDYAEAYYYRGHANNALEKYESALADYSKAIELRLCNAAVYSNRGFIHFKLGQCRKAITDYNEAIRLKSDETESPSIQENSISFFLEGTEFDEAEVYINRGVAKSQLGECEGALTDYDEAIRLKPNWATAYNNRGQTNTLLGKHQEALADYNEAIRLKPNYVKAYINRGPTNLVLGKYAEALIDLNEVIRLQPNFAIAYVNRAEAKVNLNRIDEARSDFQTALELAEQQGDDTLKTRIAERLQGLNNSAPQTDKI